MKNFLRGLRCAWPYRGRLAMSFVCALIAAILWGSTFTAVSPVLKILDSKKNLQAWVEDKISELSDEIAEINADLVEPSKAFDELIGQPRNDLHDKKLRDVIFEISKREGDLKSANFQLWLYQAAQWRFSQFLPVDPFETLVWLMVIV